MVTFFLPCNLNCRVSHDLPVNLGCRGSPVWSIYAIKKLRSQLSQLRAHMQDSCACRTDCAHMQDSRICFGCSRVCRKHGPVQPLPCCNVLFSRVSARRVAGAQGSMQADGREN